MRNAELCLCLDTTGSALMVSFVAQGETLYRFQAETDSHRYSSALLFPTLQAGLDAVGARMQDVRQIALNIGPGSFTGIRTGLTTAKTLAQFLALPLEVFTTFELIAGHQWLHGPHPEAPVAIYLDALRGQAYHASLRIDPESGPVYLTPPSLCLLGEGVPDEAHASVVSTKLVPRFASCAPVLLEDLAIFTPAVMAALLKRFPQRFQVDWRDVQPLYLQKPNITVRKPVTPGRLK